MKIFKFILIFCVFLSFQAFGGNQFYPTQADLIEFSNKDVELSNKNFDKTCNKIIENFKADKNFISAFNIDKAEYLKYRSTQINTILPSYESDPTAYGTNYPIYWGLYLQELNKDKIKAYKRMAELYCLYNSDYQPEKACSKEQIEKIFK